MRLVLSNPDFYSLMKYDQEPFLAIAPTLVKKRPYVANFLRVRDSFGGLLNAMMLGVGLDLSALFHLVGTL